jgi:tetratricopeptide (TPR) repeat protein
MTVTRDPVRLRKKLDELAARAAADPADLDARRAAGEACLRLAVLEGGDRGLLRRAVELDPYRAEAWLLLGRMDREAGAHELACERLDTAALVGGESPAVQLERAKAWIGLAIAARAATHADQAVALLTPLHERNTDPEILIALIEALVHGSATVMRERTPVLLERGELRTIDPDRLVRLLYLVVLSLDVGDKADELNRPVLDAVTRVVERARPSPALAGVLAATKAKRCTAVEITNQIDELARDLPDVRIVRLVLRERLATIDDPSQRLALFEQAMGRIPSLDGIAHDYLQLQHLVAKRSLATGDFTVARANWESCLLRDPDNLAVLENLERLAVAIGDTEAATSARARIHELRVIYTTYGPRADVVLARAAAAVLDQLETRLQATSEQPQPALDEIAELARILGRATALHRLAHEPTVRRATPIAAIDALLDRGRDDVFELAAEILAKPTFEELPLAYAHLELAKDAPDAAIVATREHELSARHDDDPAAGKWRERLAAETAMLLDPEQRAAYDAKTAELELSEVLRAHVQMVLVLLEAVGRCQDQDPTVRQAIIAQLRQLVPASLQPYFEIALRMPAALALDVFASTLLAAPLETARAHFAANRLEGGLDLLKKHAAAGADHSGFLTLMALHSIPDPRVPLETAAEVARAFARRANAVWGGAHPDPKIRAMAADPDLAFREHAACERAAFLLIRNKERAALEALWWGHPSTTDRMPPGNPPVDAWKDVPIAGGARFMLVVARAMRQSTTVWCNAQNMLLRTTYESLGLRRTVLLAQRLAYWWAVAGHEAVTASGKLELLQQAEALLKGLEHDRKTYTEVAA